MSIVKIANFIYLLYLFVSKIKYISQMIRQAGRELMDHQAIDWHLIKEENDNDKRTIMFC